MSEKRQDHRLEDSLENKKSVQLELFNRLDHGLGGLKDDTDLDHPGGTPPETKKSVSSAQSGAIRDTDKKDGYELTKLGWIPEEWEVLKIGKITTKVGSGSTPRGGEKVYSDFGVPFIRSQNVNHNRLLFEEVTFITEETHRSMSGTTVKSNDILLNITGASIGRSCVVPTDFTEGNVNQHVCIIRLNDKADNHFVQAFLSSYDGQKAILRAQVGGNREGLNHANVRAIKIPFPPLPEQRAIAACLSTWDKAIHSLTKLITQKELHKKGLMQQLLTGKKRLPGFDGEWKKKHLGEIGDFFKGAGISKSEVKKEGYPAVRYGELYTTHHNVVQNITTYIDQQSSTLSRKIKNGDILFASSGETIEEIGKCAAYIYNEIAYAGGDIIIFRPNECNSVFLGYLLNTSWINSQKASMGKGHSVVHIYPRDLAIVKLLLPSKEEQTAIAHILQCADREIKLLNQKLNRFKDQKKGLMQQLLTGKKRLYHDFQD